MRVEGNSEYKEFLSRCRLRSFTSSQVLLHEGAAREDVYILKSGVVKVHSFDNLGREKILMLLKSPSPAPFWVFTTNLQELDWRYTTLTTCEVYMTNMQVLKEYLQKDMSSMQHFFNHFSEGIHELVLMYDQLKRANSRQKLCIALKYLANNHSARTKEQWKKVAFPVSHQFLADLVGITRESATHAMKSLLDNQVVNYGQGKILEINHRKLVKMLQG